MLRRATAPVFKRRLDIDFILGTQDEKIYIPRRLEILLALLGVSDEVEVVYYSMSVKPRIESYQSYGVEQGRLKRGRDLKKLSNYLKQTSGSSECIQCTTNIVYFRSQARRGEGADHGSSGSQCSRYTITS